MTYGVDDSTGNRLITAYFEDRSAATRAVERLVAMGIPESRVQLTGDGTRAETTEHRSGGFFEALADLFLPDEDRYSYAEGLRRGGYVVSARVDDAYYDRALDILDDDGTIDIGEREKSWRSEGWTGYDASRTDSDTTRTGYAETPVTGRSSSDYGSTTGSTFGSTATTTGSGLGASDSTGFGREESIPVVEERLRIGKRDVNNGRVRVRSYVIEEPVRESVTLRDERVDVERRPVDRAATTGDDLFRERTIELEEHGEEAVVSKDARVTEELVLRKQATERTEEVSDTVRRTEVEVEDDRGTTRDSNPRRV
jgi:uncharacterized protein (TIGR02271 family)